MTTSPTEILKDEHRVIERVLAVLRRAAARLEAGERVDPSVFERGIDFIRNFADRYHHAKEENALFTTMAAHGIPQQQGPIGVMLMEHEQGRAHVRGMAEALEKYGAGDDSARTALAEHARGYADLLSEHIYKEDNILYPMGDQVMPASAQDDLLKQFRELEGRVLSPAERQRYLDTVSELEKAV
ncbi:MAG: hemerythrin domain-containing protein [Bacteroidetes bacterium]|nr:hemerythrin domain-containing protein [Bacteroidota bacterium]